MSLRRKLTQQELERAAAFARALDASAYIPESLASAIGVTPGAVGHWYRGEIAIPLRRVAKVASLLSVPPESISQEWADSIAPYLQASASTLDAREQELIDNFSRATEPDKQSIERIVRAMGATEVGMKRVSGA